MVDALITYTRQRFSPLLFGALAIFLFLFARGSVAFTSEDVFLLFLLTGLLFFFRLFDDLQHHLLDRHKPDRNYTNHAAHLQLSRTLILIGVLGMGLLFWINKFAALAMLFFTALNMVLYKVLLYRGKFRHLLPLLKYPFLCFLLLYLLNPGEPIHFSEALLSLSLFPAFILYETATDPEFPLNTGTKLLFFIAAFLPFLSSITLNETGLLSLLSIASALAMMLFLRHKATPYFLLFVLLLNRLMIPV